MKAVRNKSASRQLVLLTVLLSYVASTRAQSNLIAFKEHKAAKPTQIACPTCGLKASDPLPGTSSLECERYFSKTQIKLDDYNKIPLPSYRCKCNYTHIENKNDCGTNRRNEDSFPVTGDCLVAHVGMAIRGHNLLYRRWVDKENCFNLCQRTRIKNGHSFDCRSFEHWHRDCDSNANPDPNYGNLCASIDLNSQDKNSKAKLESLENKFPFSEEFYKQKRLAANKRASKTDICVLSNQTIDLAPKEYLPNPAVTYYEVLCIDERPRSESTSKKPTSDQEDDSNSSGTLGGISLVDSFNKFPTGSHEDTTTPSTAMNDLSGKQCKFNPCLNGGACILIDTYRFTCLCKDLFYGIYCENLGILKKCHKTAMEIIIDHKVADNLNIQTSDLFVNKKSNQEACQLSEVNKTHSRFFIKYDQCSTSKTTINDEIIYTNKLFSRAKAFGVVHDQNQYKNNYLVTLECTRSAASMMMKTTTNAPASSINRSRPQFTQLTTSVVSLMTPATSSKAIQEVRKTPEPKNNNCIIDLFNLRMRLFLDNKYEQEYVKSKRNKIAYGKKVNVQFYVEPSERLAELYRIQEHLQYMHLTLLSCWLTPTSSPFSNIKQILVSDGCPKKGVNFLESVTMKNSIQFGFKITAPVVDSETIYTSQYYLHCDPEICIDQTLETEKNRNIYGHYKSCKNITAVCDERKQMAEFAIRTSSDEQDELDQFRPENSQCNSLLVEGPLYMGMSQNEQINGSISLSLCSLLDIQKCIIILLLNVCYRLFES